MINTDNLPALITRMMISKQIHEQVGDPRDTLHQVRGRCFDRGNDLEERVVENWFVAKGHNGMTMAATLDETTKDLAIGAIHRLTIEGAGASEQ